MSYSKAFDFVSVKCPYSGRTRTLMVTSGTKVWNSHKWDGDPHGSLLRGTKEAKVCCGNKCFHVDTNNPDGVLYLLPEIKFRAK